MQILSQIFKISINNTNFLVPKSELINIITIDSKILFVDDHIHQGDAKKCTDDGSNNKCNRV